MSDDTYLDDFDDDLHIPTTTSTQPLRQSLDLFTTLDLANVNPSQRQTYDAMLEHHMARVRIPIRHLTEQKSISRDISRDVSQRTHHDTDMSSIAGTRVLPSRPHIIDHKRIRSTVDNQLSHAVLAFLESAAKRKHQRKTHKSTKYAHVESRIHKTLSASPSVASISPTKQKRHMISPAQPQRQNLTSSETSTPLRTPHGMPPSPMMLSQPSQPSHAQPQTSHERSQTALSQATIERERIQRERARMEMLEEENEKLKQKVAQLEAENEKLRREVKERRKRDKVRALMAEAAEKEKEKEQQQQQQQQEKQRTKSHKKSISIDTPLQTSQQPQQLPPPMGRKSSVVSLHIPTATNPTPLASTPVITPITVTITPSPVLAPTPAPVSSTATSTPTTQPTRTSPMKSSASSSSLKHKPTRSDQMRAEARRAAAEAATQKEQERQQRDAERDKLIRARAKRQAKQKQQDTYGELLGHSTDNMDLLELSISHEEKIRPGIPKLSMERAIALITPRDDEEEKEEEYVDEEFESYDEEQESEALNNMLQPNLTINTEAPTIATSTRLTPSHISIPTIISPSHAQRCAVDGCRATRSTRGYCIVHASMHSPMTSPSKSSKTSQLHDDSLTLSSDLMNDSTLEYEASHDGLTQIQSHKPPISGLKLDFSNMDLQQNRHLWAVDNVSDSFEITKSGTFKRGDFTLNKRGLSVRGDDTIRTTSISTPRLEEVGKTSPKKRGSVAKNYLMQKEDLVILNVLGRGSSGVVYRCFDLPSLSLLALKCISITEQDKRRHITRELVTLASDQSPYLIGFKGAYFDEGHIYLALEYMNQGSLQDWIDTHGALSEWSLAYIFEKVLHGLHHLHQRQTIHRDIKPHNILINDEGQVKVADFGIMAQIKDPSIEQCNTFVGTLIYMSPERLGGAPYSYSCDIWSMGLAFLTCTLGKYAIPHTGHFELITKIQNAAKLVDDLPSKYSRDLKSFAAACLNSDPASRPTAQQLLSHPFLQRFREGSTTSREIPCPPEFISQRVDHDVPPSTQVSARRSSTITRTAPTPTIGPISTPSHPHSAPTSSSMIPPDTARRGSLTTQKVIDAHMGTVTGTAAALAREKYDNTAKVCEALVKRIQAIQKSPETPDRKRSPHANVTAEQIKQIAISLEVPQQLVHDIYTEKEKKSNPLLAS